MPVLSCTIGNSKIDGCLLDLGASINLMPYSVYEKLDLGPLQPSRSTLQLADRSVKVPEGIVEDVLIQVEDLVFPADFIVLAMEPIDPSHRKK